MEIICPHCQAAYQLESVEDDSEFTCVRCHEGFTMADAIPAPVYESLTPEDDSSETPDEVEPTEVAQEESLAEAIDDTVADESLSADEAPVEAEETATDESTDVSPEVGEVAAEPSGEEATQAEETVVEEDGEADEPAAASLMIKIKSMILSPVVLKVVARIPIPAMLKGKLSGIQRAIKWLLLAVLVMAIVVAGLYFTRSMWPSKDTVRSTLKKNGLPVPVYSNDWNIPQDKLYAKWVKRMDSSRVMMISGVVENKLNTELALPAIRILLYAKAADKVLIETRLMPITKPPLRMSLRRVPYIPPPEDHTPVAAKDSREFVLILEKLPEGVGSYELKPSVSQKQNKK